MLTRLTTVIISSYIQVSNYYVVYLKLMQGGAEIGLQLSVHGTQSLFLYYYLLIIIFHTNNCNPSFVPPCIMLYYIISNISQKTFWVLEISFLEKYIALAGVVQWIK